MRKYSVSKVAKQYETEGFSPEDSLTKARAFVDEMYRFDRRQYYRDSEFTKHESPRPDLFPPRD